MSFTEENRSEIYKEYAPKVMRYLKGRVKTFEDAEDLCSEVFLKFYKNEDKFDESRASVSTWIYRICQNTLIDFFRTHKEECNIDELPEPESGMSIEEDYCRNETLNELADALSELDEKQRKVILLHYYGHKKLNEIAGQMSLSYSYVKILHANALKNLEKFLSEL